jgi:protein-S-isoprenylcysteine O-methyltransferase Ste14
MRDRVLAWTVTIVAIGSAYMAGRASWNAWDWPVWIRWYVGFPLAFVFSSLSSWSIVRLGLDQSMGANNGLVTDGPFAYVRHPTYLGNLVLCAGWILLAASWPALIAAGALAALYLYAVPHEERWLARTYGADYESYRARVKRWGL